jgi:hypothetical protein
VSRRFNICAIRFCVASYLSTRGSSGSTTREQAAAAYDQIQREKARRVRSC